MKWETCSQKKVQLVSIDMKDVMDSAVVNSVQNVQEEDKFKAAAFVKE